MSNITERKNSATSHVGVQHIPDFRSKSLAAASTIERAYLSYRDRQMFTLLKHAIRAAERSWTHEVLRKISPNEAALLEDPSVKAKIRFRFAGKEFPPVILFKIYLINNGTNYISGRKTIRPATNAAVDACRLMGHRKFYDQMILDACQFENDKITDLVDVTTVKDYMQYLSNLDEMPCYLGGKENHWRHLSLEALPRQNIMYDIVQYLKTKSPSARLQAEMPTLLSRPITQEIQLEQFRTISKLQSPPSSAFSPQKSLSHHLAMAVPTSQRRSSQSKRRVARMRKIYSQEGSNEDFTVRPTSSHSRKDADHNSFSHPATASREPTAQLGESPLPSARNVGRSSDAEPGEEEARELYEWTRDLDYDDINRGVFPSTRSVSFSSPLTKRVFVS